LNSILPINTNPTETEPSETGQRTIFLIEDEVPILDLSTVMLMRAGFRVLKAANATEAALVWQKEGTSVDLLISDISIPGRSGPEMAREFRTSRPGLKIIFASGNTRDSVSDSAQFFKGAKFLLKPFSMKSLLDLARAELGINSS